MNTILKNIINQPVQQQKKISKSKLRKLTYNSPILKMLEHGSFNSYDETEGIYHFYNLEAGYQRGLFDMVNKCTQSTNSVVLYYIDHSETAIFRIYNAADNTSSTMHFHGESVREAIEYLFNIRFTTEILILKPTKDKVFEERMKQSKTEFDGFKRFHDHLIFYDSCTAFELTATTDKALKAGITHMKYVDQMFSHAEWVDTAQHPQKDGLYKWLWYEDDNLIMYNLCQIHNNEGSLFHDFYFSYDESLMNSSAYYDFDNEMLLMKLNALCRKDNIGNILAGL
ncbi:hypothetical protein [Pontibacter virosus]|uniref:Uncharacterized protein n=1 Tax=Pontibacter virosus TaxID=1765052 RepID=A0A2U1B3B7_9BACT|nr:hypothetical protein [Pontibacter virosus]PVY43165.1 hypothetical protein C8E01_102342 [Pontibacter virosus]